MSAAPEAALRGDVQFKAGIVAFVHSHGRAVEPEFGDQVHALEFQHHAFSGELTIQVEVFAVPPDAAPVAGCIVHRVLGVPGVGQRDALPSRIVVLRLGALRKRGSTCDDAVVSRSKDPSAPEPVACRANSQPWSKFW